MQNSSKFMSNARLYLVNVYLVKYVYFCVSFTVHPHSALIPRANVGITSAVFPFGPVEVEDETLSMNAISHEGCGSDNPYQSELGKEIFRQVFSF